MTVPERSGSYSNFVEVWRCAFHLVSDCFTALWKQSTNPANRAILQRETIHILDLRAAVETEFPENAELVKRTGTRTFLSTPMLREGTPIGLINIRRTEVRPFSDKQIKLLETFAAQAVIAIENVRLFQELEARTHQLAQSVGE